MVPASPRDRATPGGSLRILLAERRASAHSEVSRRLKSRGHEVLARVTSAQGAIDYAGFLAPDVVLVSPVIDNAPGLAVAMAVAKKQPGVAAVVLTSHPAAADPASRPKWGSVALLPVDAEADEMHEELWRAVMQARKTSAAAELSPAAGIEPDSLTWSLDAGAIEDPSVTEMVDALYSPPAIELVTTPLVPGSRPANPMQENDDIVARAATALVERARLTRITAMRLMEQESADTGQSIADVARAMLFDVDSDTIEVVAPGE
jgi:AmiR/NasT family two-component response regulator